MKAHRLIGLIILNLILISIPAQAGQHEIIYLDGKSRIGIIAEFEHDSILFNPIRQDLAEKIPLDSILYIRNDSGKLFYISDRLNQYIGTCLGRGGKIITIEGEEIPYSALRDDEIIMFSPKIIYYDPGSRDMKKISLFKIHKLKVDYTNSEYAVRKGFYAGAGITALRFLIKFRGLGEFLDVNLISGRVDEIYPATVVTVPLITFGWMIYDYILGEREFIINAPINKPT